MKKKLFITALLSCTSVTAFAQVIGQDADLLHREDMPMTVRTLQNKPSSNGVVNTTTSFWKNTAEGIKGCFTLQNPDYPAYPPYDIVPECNGVPQSVTGGEYGFLGEYSTIQVTSGTEYTFSTSKSSIFITIGNSTGDTVLASGTGSVTWTADFSGIVRFYTHLDDNCGFSDEKIDRLVQCGGIVLPPANDDCSGVTPAVLNAGGDSVTLTGTTAGGTASPEEMLTFSTGAVWEAVTLTGDCNNLTIDFCGTNPDVTSNTFPLLTGCPLTGYVIGNYESTSCEDGNLTITFKNLPAGTYYIPVKINNIRGEYTMHVKSEDSEDCPPAPKDCADFVVPSNNLENGYLFGDDQDQHLAIDIPVADQGFAIKGIEPTVFGEATYFNFIIYADHNGLPGTQIATRTGSVENSVVTGNRLGIDFIKYSVLFDTSFEFEANKTYWIEILTDAKAWESTSISQIGNHDVFQKAGGSWDHLFGAEFVFDLMCDETMGTSDVNSTGIHFYPNPVKDVLNISADQKITSVSIYNVAGQKVINNVKADNGKVNVSRLTSGTYIVTAILENGKTETFKVIKK